MRCVCLLPGLVLALTQPLATVAQSPCPAKVERSAIAGRLCREVLPSNNTVLMKDGNGGLCACRCAELELMPYKQVMVLKAARDSANASNLRRFVHARKPMAYSSTVGDYAVVLGEDTSPTPDMSELDPCLAVIVRTMQRINERGVVDLDGFELGVLATMDTNDAYPSMGPGQPGGGVEGALTVPLRFVMDPAVQWELTLFMLLHELGHGVNYEDSGEYVSEYEADMWAANVGLPAFFNHNVQRVAAVRRAAAEQLHNYFISVHTPETEQFSSSRSPRGDDFPMNVYPILQCRLDSIRYGVLLKGTPGDPFLGYPGECWENPQANFPQNNKLSAEKICAEDHHKPTPCEKYPQVCDVLVQTDLLMQDWTKLMDKCAQRPDLCFRGGKFTELSQQTAKGRMKQIATQRKQFLDDIERARATAVRTGRELQGARK